ncbi:MAG: hypothetical protein HC886_09220 [Leptolyngbyaceae cyanobacterium SM1_1_3]|nr:hypothetical protein [Leptolyngbyaceae cyanobacterium SM1_1_3]NJN02735.1 hypothetical protein [Leptolyngbyaceae cyanobacterium RM1_1_2]NJO09283.1 hypothetical protein [Leptolyngbyaceae cyanobacterium SL_1_1]
MIKPVFRLQTALAPYPLVRLLPLALASASVGLLPGLAQAQTPPPFPRSAGGSRGDICIVSPLIVPQASLTLWSDRPLFIWDGQISRLEIVQTDTGQTLWQAEPDAETTQLRYGADNALQAGQDYLWRVYGGSFSTELYRIPFRVMAPERRAVIADELAVLKTQFAIEQTPPDEQILRQIAYFGDRYLWADALQVAASGESDAARDYVQLAIEETCGIEMSRLEMPVVIASLTQLESPRSQHILP